MRLATYEMLMFCRTAPFTVLDHWVIPLVAILSRGNHLLQRIR